MREYERSRNVNTPEFWNRAWDRDPEGGANKAPVRELLLQIYRTLPEANVYEYGFGALHLARELGKDRWAGRDISSVAVAHATAAGFQAKVLRCGDCEGFRRGYVAALEVLEHLDLAEMREFLERAKGAPHAFFSVPDLPDEDFEQHVRRFESDEDLQALLLEYWPNVDVYAAGHYRLAHCYRTAAPVLTIGCSTLLDFTGVQWTLAALNTSIGYDRMGGKIELLVVDNHPEPTTGEEEAEIDDMRDIVEGEGARYVRWAERQGTYPGKDRLKREARAPWVLTMDSHVMLSPGTVETVLETIEANPTSQDFFHFPNIGHRRSAPAAMDYRQLNMIWRRKEWTGDKAPCGYYGWTGLMNEPGEPYPIAAMITSCYLLRKDAWISAGGYDPILGNYGGWEGPLQTKWWMMGRRVLSLRHRRPWRGEPLHHWHLFNNFKRLRNETGRVHTGRSKQRNFMASSAVIGGEAFARWLCERQKGRWESGHIQQGVRAGLALREDFVSKLARPEWEDIFEFFAWQKAEGIPGHLTEW